MPYQNPKKFEMDYRVSCRRAADFGSCGVCGSQDGIFALASGASRSGFFFDILLIFLGLSWVWLLQELPCPHGNGFRDLDILSGFRNYSIPLFPISFLTANW